MQAEYEKQLSKIVSQENPIKWLVIEAYFRGPAFTGNAFLYVPKYSCSETCTSVELKAFLSLYWIDET